MRFQNIDILRGIVMIIMCIDHARDYTGLFPMDPMTLEDTPFWLYILRILAHLCAPTFILLAGISAAIVGCKKDKNKLSSFLLTRGFILCLLEVTLVNWGWSFNPLYSTIYLQVIWAIGISMIALAALIRLRKFLIFSICSSIIVFHNLFDGVAFSEGTVMHYIWSFLIQKNLLPIGDYFMVRTTYPILPVVAIMGLGYLVGGWYVNLDSDKRRRNLWISSILTLSIFVITRLIFKYGDPYDVDCIGDISNYIMSAINLTKYPMSFNFIMLYISVTMAILAATEGRSYKNVNFLIILGKTPMFFYIAHLYVLHLVIISYLLINGYRIDLVSYLGGVPTGVGFPAWWLLWVVPFTIVVLILPCRYYYKLKQSKKYKWTNYI